MHKKTKIVLDWGDYTSPRVEKTEEFLKRKDRDGVKQLERERVYVIG